MAEIITQDWYQCRLGCWHKNSTHHFGIITVWTTSCDVRIYKIVPGAGYPLVHDETKSNLLEAQSWADSIWPQ